MRRRPPRTTRTDTLCPSTTLFRSLDELARDPRVVGVGEAGLDFHYDNSPRPDQRRAFAAQIAIAKAAGKALVIHCRDRSEEHTSELQSLMRISYAVFCLKKKKTSYYSSSKQHIS